MDVSPDEYAVSAEFYDQVIPYRDRPDVAFFVEAARQAGGPVLEVGCGTGRVLIPTARAGVNITGLDRSASMLAVCRERLRQAPEEVQARVSLVEADMRFFDLQRSFALITLPFRPFQHLLSVEDQLACLQCLGRHLAPQGRLILDIFNPSLESLADQDFGRVLLEEPEFRMPDGRRVVRRHRVTGRDLFNQVNYVELLYDVTHPDGRQEHLVHAFPMRYLFRFEAEHLLIRAGFEVTVLYADYDQKPYGSIYPGELVFVARNSTVRLQPPLGTTPPDAR
jgi:SAM-dependent methyltransferase